MDDNAYKSILAEVLAADDISGVYAALASALQLIDCDVIGYHVLRRGNEPVRAHAGMLLNPLEANRLRDYFGERGAIDQDAALSRKIAAMHPFHWFDIEIEPNLSSGMRNLLKSAREDGFIDGIAIPVIARPGDLALFSLSARGKMFELPTVDHYCLQCVLTVAHRRINELSAEQPPGEALTARERDVLALIAQGRTNKEIAKDLSISPHTVDTLVRRIFAKLQVGNRIEAALRFAFLDSVAA